MDSSSDAEPGSQISRQTRTMRLAEQALETDDLEALLGDGAATVVDELGTDRCKIFELMPSGDEAVLRAGAGCPDDRVGHETVSTGPDSRTGAAIRRESPLVREDCETESPGSDPKTPTDRRARSGVSVRIGSSENPWGVLETFADDRRAFAERDVAFVESVADLLAASIENERPRHQLRREETLTERIVETSPVGILVIDADGEIRFANERAEEILGREREEITAFTYDDPEWSLLDADGEPLPPEETPFERVVREKGPVRNVEFGVRRPDDARVWLSVNGAPLQDDGELSGVVLALEDRTEQKRLQSELELTFQRITDGFFGVDADWTITYLNERAEELIDPEGRGIVGKNIWETFPEAVGTVFETEYRRAMETQESTSFEEYFPPLATWFEVNVYPSESGISVYFRDVTERKTRQQELTQYETIVETINDGIYVTDDELRYTMVNEAYTELTGYDRDELLGEHASLVVNEDTLERASEMRKAMADDEVTNPTLDGAITTAAGDRVPVEATFATLPTDRGTQRRVGVVRDVSDRKEQRRKLEESERRYRTLVENFPNGAVGLFDRNLRYTAVGGQLLDVADIAPENRVGSSVYDIYPEAIVEEIEPYFQAALEGEPNSFEVDYHGRHLFAYTLPIRDATDEIYAGMLVVQDVTELKEAQRRLEESNERLEQFAYAASHDLQEPLRMVSSYLQLIERRYADELDEDGREFVAFAVDGAERMREMIDGLLTYSRVETEGDPLEPVELDAVLEDVLEDLKMRIEERDAEITVESLPRVRGDARQLRQLFQNLLSNAIEYSDAAPRVRVSAERTGQRWTISVRDEGMGIDPADQERIFEVFQRLHSREEHAGTGIGLALCQRIVDRHGGQLRVDSEPGEGSTFSFTLPPA